MQISVSSCCWWDDPLDEVLRKASSCGFRAIEILAFAPYFPRVHLDLTTTTTAELRRKLEDHGLVLSGLHAGSIWTTTEELRRNLTDYAKMAIEAAAELECPTVVEGGPLRDEQPFEPFIDSLLELQRELENTPVQLVLENHHNYWLETIEDYRGLLTHISSPKIGICADTGHFTAAGVDPVRFAETFKERIYHVHVKDHIGEKSVPLGKGTTNNREVARRLREYGYQGFLTQELELEDKKNADIHACEGRDYMLGLLEA